MIAHRNNLIVRLIVIIAILTGLVALRPVQVALAATVTVTTFSDENDGSCSDGDCSLRDAIATAASGDTVSITGGGTIDLTMGELVIDKDLILTTTASVTLSGGNRGQRVMRIEGASQITVQINGPFTLSGAAPVGLEGGGLYIDNAVVTISGATITSNTAANGGGIFVGAAAGNALTLNNCTIASNTTRNGTAPGGSAGHGAGIYFMAGTLNLNDTTLQFNMAGNGADGATGVGGLPGSAGGDGGSGAGLYLTAAGSATINRSTFFSNWTGMGGNGGWGQDGAFGTSGGSVCPPVDGTDGTSGTAGGAAGQGGSGGGIYSLGALTITHSTLRDNTAQSGGTGGYGGSGRTGGSGSNGTGCNGGNGGAGGHGAIGGAGGSGGSGAGIYNAYTGVWTISNSTLYNNQIATGGAGGAGGSGGMGGQGGQAGWPPDVGGNGGNGGNGALNGVAGNNGFGAAVYDLGELTLTNSTVSQNFINNNNGSVFAGNGGSGGSGGNGDSGGGDGGDGGNGANCNPGGNAGQGGGLALMGAGDNRLENMTLVDNTVGIPADCAQFGYGGAGGTGGIFWTSGSPGAAGAVGTNGITGSTAAEGSAGLFAAPRAGQVRVRNSILDNQDIDTTAGNCASTGVSPIVDGGYNLIGDAADLSCGFTDNLQTGAPLLAAFANNGAHTQTRLPGTGSPAIDTGSCLDLDGNSITSEQRAEVPRPFGVTCDIGAVETGIFVWLGGSTGWTATWNWSGDVVPGATDTALFNVTSSTNADLYSAASIGRIIVTNGYGGAFNLYDTLTINGDFAPANGGINLNPGSVLDINGNFTPSGGSVNLGSGGILRLSGDYVRSGGTFNANTGQVQFDGTGAQNLAGNMTNFYDLRVNKASGTLTLGASMGITNQLRLAGGTFDLGAYHADRPVAGGGAMVLDSGTTLQVGGANNFPANYSTYTINANSTVEYNAAGEQTISNLNGWPPYGHLVVSGSLTKTLAGETRVGGTLTVTNATLAASNNDLWVTGGWVSDGLFDPGTGTVHIDGAFAITGNTNPAFHHLVVEGTGDLVLSAGDTHISGDFTNWNNFDGGTGTLTFDSGGTQNLTLNSVASFNNLTVITGTTLIETESLDNAATNGALTNYGTIRKTRDIFGLGDYYFGLAGGPVNGADVILNVTDDSFTSIQVDRIDSNHPNRSGSAASSGAGWGTYWSITPVGTGTVDVTLPTTFTPDANDKVCRYTGTGTVWDCARSSNTTSTITRNGVTTFSDWAAGNEVGPTAIELDSFDAKAAPDNSAVGWLLALLTVFALGGLWLMRKFARD